MLTARTESCSTSVMTPIAEQVVGTARTAPLLTFKNVAKVAENTELVLKSSRLLIEVMVFEAIDALSLTRSLSSTLEKLSLKMSVIAA